MFIVLLQIDVGLIRRCAPSSLHGSDKRCTNCEGSTHKKLVRGLSLALKRGESIQLVPALIGAPRKGRSRSGAFAHGYGEPFATRENYESLPPRD